MKLERRIEEAVPAGQQLQELGMRLRCDDTSSEHVSINFSLKKKRIHFILTLTFHFYFFHLI